MHKTYQAEFQMCRELHAKNQGCAWGKCEKCGVIPLLHKLATGEVLEKAEEIDNLKQKIFE